MRTTLRSIQIILDKKLLQALEEQDRQAYLRQPATPGEAAMWAE